jgi:hypothetical protein
LPKHSFKLGAAAADIDSASGPPGQYAGEKPPPGVYAIILKRIRMKENSNGDDMLNVLHEISEPAGSPKAKYNGYGIWNNLNVTEVGAPFVNAFLDVHGLAKKVFWGSGVTLDDANPPEVIKIGTKRPQDLKARAATKDETYNGNTRLSIVQYIDADAEDTEDDDSDDGDDLEPIGSLDEDSDDAAVEESEEPITEAELKAMAVSELTDLAAEWEIELPEKITKKALIALLVAAQEEEPEEGDDADSEGDDAVAEDDEADAEEATEDEDADEAGDEDGDDAGEESDDERYTEEDLMSEETTTVARLKEILTDEFEQALPKPPIRRKLVLAILKAQEAAYAEEGEAPF